MNPMTPTHPHSSPVERRTDLLQDFIAWAKKISDQEHEDGAAGVNYLNGEGKTYLGDAWDDLDALLARAALSTPTPDQRGLSEDEIADILWEVEHGKTLYSKPSRDSKFYQQARAIISRLTASHAAEGRSYAEGIEDAAKVADGFTCGVCGMDGKASAAIRTLSPKPTTQGEKG